MFKTIISFALLTASGWAQSCAITSPVAASTTSAQYITLKASTSSAPSQASMQYFINTEPVGLSFAPGSAFQAQWSPSATWNGQHQIYGILRNSMGATIATCPTITFNTSVITTSANWSQPAPNLSVVCTPADGATWSGTSVSCTATINNPDFATNPTPVLGGSQLSCGQTARSAPGWCLKVYVNGLDLHEIWSTSNAIPTTIDTTKFANGQRVVTFGAYAGDIAYGLWQRAEDFENGATAMQLLINPLYNLNMKTGDTASVTASIQNTDLSISTPGSCTWSTDTPAVATLSSTTGTTVTVTAVGSGTDYINSNDAFITATCGGLSEIVSVMIRPNDVLAHFMSDGSISTTYVPNTGGGTPYSTYLTSTFWSNNCINLTGGGSNDYKFGYLTCHTDSLAAGVNAIELQPTPQPPAYTSQAAFAAAETAFYNQIHGIGLTSPDYCSIPGLFLHGVGSGVYVDGGTHIFSITQGTNPNPFSPPIFQQITQDIHDKGCFLGLSMTDEYPWTQTPLMSQSSLGIGLTGNLVCVSDACSVPWPNGGTNGTSIIVTGATGHPSLNNIPGQRWTNAHLNSGVLTFTATGVGSLTATSATDPNLEIEPWGDWEVYIATGAGTAQAQTGTFTVPSASSLPGFSLADGVHVCWLPAASNTGAGPTLAANGGTARTITGPTGSALVANDILSTVWACGIYDQPNTRWLLQNPQTTLPNVFNRDFPRWSAFRDIRNQRAAITGTPIAMSWPLGAINGNPTTVYNLNGDSAMSEVEEVYTTFGNQSQGIGPSHRSAPDYQGSFFKKLLGNMSHTPGSRPISLKTQGNLLGYGLQGYNCPVSSVADDTITFSAPCPLNTPLYPGFTRITLSGTSNAAYNVNMYVNDVLDSTHWTVSLRSSNISCVGSCPSNNTGKFQYSDGSSIPVQSAGLSGWTPLGACAVTTNVVPSGQTVGAVRDGHRGQNGNYVGTTDANLNAANWWALREDQACATGNHVVVRQRPQGSATGGTANVQATNYYQPGINLTFQAQSPQVPAEFFLSQIYAYAMGATELRVYGQGSSAAVSDNQMYNPTLGKGFDVFGNGWGDTNDFTLQGGVHPFWDGNMNARLGFAGMAHANLPFQNRFAKYMLGASRLPSPDCGKFFDIFPYTSAAGKILFVIPLHNGITETCAVTLTPYETSGQAIQVADIAWNQLVLSSLSAGTASDSHDYPYATPRVYIFPVVAAADAPVVPVLSVASAAHPLSESVTNATKVIARCAYHRLLVDQGTAGTVDCGNGVSCPLIGMDRRMGNSGNIFCRLTYQDSGDKVLSTGDIQQF